MMSDTPARTTHAVEVRHDFAATPERVFDAWLSPSLVQKWFGPGLGRTEPVRIDARVGGRFRIVQVRNGQSIGHTGEYRVLERPHRLAFSWATDDDDGHDEVRVAIEPSAGGATVHLVHTVDAQWQEFAGAMHEAWRAMLVAMDAVLAEPTRGGAKPADAAPHA